MNTTDLWSLPPLTFKRGQRFHIYGGSPSAVKIYIVGVMSDDGEDVVVYRWWRKHKKYWHIEAKSAWELSGIIRMYKLGKAEKKKDATSQALDKVV